VSDLQAAMAKAWLEVASGLLSDGCSKEFSITMADELHAEFAKRWANVAVNDGCIDLERVDTDITPPKTVQEDVQKTAFV